MPVAVDRSGHIYGRLTVVAYAGKSGGNKLWLCRCACGTLKTFHGGNLQSGASQSCGCWHKEVVSRIRNDLRGQRFGRLLVTDFGPLRGEHTVYTCKCDCGGVVAPTGSDLLSGRSTSCGCYHKEQTSIANTTHGLSHTLEYGAAISRKRLERKRRLDVKWTLNMEFLLRKLQPRCVVCDKATDLSIDHVLPLSRGHGLEPGNAVILCKSCNSKKRARLLNKLDPITAYKITVAANDFKAEWLCQEHCA